MRAALLFLGIIAAVLGAKITDNELIALGNRLQHGLLLQNDTEFASHVRQWNARFDKIRPRAALFCADEAEVQEVIRTLQVFSDCYTVRSAGHSFPGWSAIDGCVLIDVKAINYARYDKVSETAVIGPAVNFWDFTTFMAGINRTTTHGFGPTVSFGGYAQGGGVGLTHRKYGLAIDNLLGARLVLTNGTIVVANYSSHKDLFWAIRGGGGGNWGVVTQYTFNTYDASAPVLYVMYSWRFSKRIVNETGSIWQSYFRGNDDPDFGLYWRITGNPVLGEMGTTVQIYGIYTGELAAGRAKLAAYIELFPTAPHMHKVEQMMIDEAYKKFMGPFRLTPHTGFFLQSRLLQEPMEQAAFPKLAEQLDKLHVLETFSLIWMDPMGGKVAEVDPGATAFPWRGAFANFAAFVFYLTPGQEEHARGWMEDTWGRLGPHMGEETVYINFCFENITDAKQAYYGANQGRLQQVKAAYDPNGKMHFPQSIQPSFT